MGSAIECVRAGTAADQVAAIVVAELVALSIVEHTHAPDVRIRVRFTGALAGELTDTGRGMRLEPDRGDTISHAERALTSVYPVRPADPKLEALLWGRREPLGPVVPNALCEEFVFQSRRNGEAWEQAFARGVPRGPARLVGPTDDHGTSVVFRIDAELATAVLDARAWAERFAQLRAHVPGLDLELET